MADFSMVTGRIATGAALAGPDDVAALLTARIGVVVDAREEFDDAPLFAGTGMAYLWNPTADDGASKPPEWFGKALDFTLPFLAQPRARILYHCAAGVNRGPSLCFGLLLALGLPPGEAEAMIRTARPQVGLAYKGDAETAVAALGYT